MREAIAEEQVVFEHRNGTRTAGLIRIEKPYVTDDNECRCPVVIEGLHESMPEISGTSTLQALLLAVCFCSSLLRDFVESGGRILRRSEDDGIATAEEVFDLDSCFGVLGAAAGPGSRRRPHQVRKHA